MVCKESVVEMARVEFNEKLKNSTIILLDVAGTTTAISFVKVGRSQHVCIFKINKINKNFISKYI